MAYGPKEVNRSAEFTPKSPSPPSPAPKQGFDGIILIR